MAFYVLKYVTKGESPIDKIANYYTEALHKSNIKNSDEDNDARKGRRRLFSLLMHISAKQETPSTLACLYLLRESAIYFSHNFVTLHLDNVMSSLDSNVSNCGRTVFLSKAVNENCYKFKDDLDEYIRRPLFMSKVCLNDFKEQWEIVTSGSESDKLLFGNNADKSRFFVRQRKVSFVLRLVSSPLPFFKIDEHCSPEKKELFGKGMLFLFKPFRCEEDLKQHDESWLNSFMNYLDSLKLAGNFSRVQQIVDFWRNNNDYHTSSRTQINHDDDLNYYKHLKEQYKDTSADSSCENDNFDEDSDEEEVSTMFEDLSPEEPEFFIDPTSKMRYESTDIQQYGMMNSVLEYGKQLMGKLPTFADSLKGVNLDWNLTKYNGGFIERDTIINRNNKRTHNNNNDTEYRSMNVQIIATTVQDVGYKPNRAKPETIGMYPQIWEVSAFFQLDEKQHIAFSTMALILLREWCRSTGGIIPSDLKTELDYLIDNDVIKSGEYQLPDALRRLTEAGKKFKPGKVNEWLDCGNKEVTVFTNQRVLEFDYEKKTPMIDPTSKLINSIRFLT